MNLLEAKKLLQNNGYKLIREDAYMDAMDQELDDIQRQKTLTYACEDESILDLCLDKFLDGTANARAKDALGRLFDLCVNGELIDKIKNMKVGDSITFTEIPDWYGRYPANSNFVREYIRNYGEEAVKKMIGLIRSKRNAAVLEA